METDDKSFHFNLESNGRLKQPMKYEIKDMKKKNEIYDNIILHFCA